MTTSKVIASARARGIYFDGIREWQNSMVGYGYCVYTPDNGFIQATTLDGLHDTIKRYPKIPRNKWGLFYY